MFRSLAALTLFAATGLTAQIEVTRPPAEPRRAQLEAEKELIGKVLNYEYLGWSDLRVLINEDGISWEGIGGALKDMRGRSTGLRVSKIADGVYFGTWVTANGGEDSVVWDLKGMTVFAHLYNAQRKTVFQADGVIKCYGDATKCVAPDTTPMSTEERQAIGRRNASQRAAE